VALLICLAGGVFGPSGDGFNLQPEWYWDHPQHHHNTVISRAEGAKIVQNPTVALLHNGDLVVAFAHNNYVSDAVVTDASIEWSVSHDGGGRWERGQPVASAFAGVPDNCPRRAAQSCGGTRLAVFSYGWENSADTPEKRKELADQGYYLFTPEEGNAAGVVSIIHRAWMSRSRDGGQTWERSDIALPARMPHLACYGDIIALRDGTFVQPMWGRFDLKKEPKYVSSLVLRSEDDGEHWEIRTAAKAKDLDFNETSITQAANGDLVALMRTSGQRELWTAVSPDGGRTWSEPRDSTLRGSTPYLVTSADGLVVAVYARRQRTPGGGGFERTGMYACVSRDNGQRWDAEHQVALVGAGTEFVDGYPSAVALPDGSVYAVYGVDGASAIGGTRFHPLRAEFGR